MTRPDLDATFDVDRLLDLIDAERNPHRCILCTRPSQAEACPDCLRALNSEQRRGCGGCGRRHDQHSATCPVVSR